MPNSILRSLTARTLVVSSAFAVLLCATVVVLIVAMRDQRTAGRLALRAQETRTAVADLERSVVTLDNGLRAFVATGRELALRPFATARRTYPAQLQTLTRLIAAERGARPDLRRIREKIDDYVDLWALPLIGVARERLGVARNVIANNTGRLRIEDVRGEFARLAARERGHRARARAQPPPPARRASRRHPPRHRPWPGPWARSAVGGSTSVWPAIAPTRSATSPAGSTP